MTFSPRQFLSTHPQFDFMGRRWWGFTASILLTVVALIAVMTQGFNLGIDFTGGVLVEMRTEGPTDLHALRQAFAAEQFGEVSLQNLGTSNEVMLRVPLHEAVNQQAVVAKIRSVIAQAIPGTVEYRKIDFVGPAVGSELVRSSVIALLLSFAAIMLYVWFRFEWQFGVGAIASLVHDSIMVIGFYAVTQFEFGLNAIAAVLTIIGYSINDSVVIYDRIRENMRKYKKMSIFDLINKSLNETLARTILTSITVLLAALSLALFGGEVLRGFSWSLVFGLAVGIYSSIFISAPALIYLNLRAGDVGETPTAPKERARA